MSNLKNFVQLLGNVGNDIELKTISTGAKTARLSIATNEYYKNNKGEKVQETQWHTAVLWGVQAELASKILTKGNEVLLKGKLVHRSYDDAAGNKRYITEVKVDEFHKLTREPKPALA